MKILSLFIFVGIICSCNPTANFELPQVKKQLVVDGWIENGQNAKVILTYNTSYFSNLDSASFRSLVASRAKVTISDGQNSEILTLTRDTNYFPSYVYEGNEIIGAEGKSYYLTVEDEVDTVHAVTSIPFHGKIDTLWIDYANNNDTMGIIRGRFTDNANETNYYRTFTSKYNGSNVYIPTLLSCFSDTYFNGQTVTFSLRKGIYNQLKPLSNIYFRKGDSILVKISSIDKASYNYWLAYQEAIINATSPFSAEHNKLISNTDKGLGIWCGYGSSYYPVIAK